MIRALLLHLVLWLDRLRRNHALEHATLHLLSRTYPQALLIGRSDRKGFYLYGEVPIEAVGQAVFGAVQRLRAGESRLAIHPNCGTNLITAATLTTLATVLALGGARGTRQRLDRLPLALLASLIALLLARPAGQQAQRHLTTRAELGRLQVLSIERLVTPGAVVHRVRTSG
jgi:hypothetical protein